MTGRESFLSVARAAMATETRAVYSDKTVPVARQDAVYTWLRTERDAPLSAIWHLLSWCVVALEEHLAEGHLSESGGAEPSASEIRVVQGSLADDGFAISGPTIDRAIRALDEHRRGAWQRGRVGD